jgi:predicted nucleotidyltransferase
MAEALRDRLYEVGYAKDELREVINFYIAHPKFNTICDWVDEERNPDIELAAKKFLENLEPAALAEDIEKHEELNPKLFEDNKLKPEVREKMLAIVDEFTAGLEEKQIGLEVEDILFLGSNASYNYTKDSDIDLHIVVNAEKLDCSKEIADALYGAFRTIFNKNIEIDFYGIPVELYVEFTDSNRVSNGIYSVQNDEWIKEPVAQDIPEIDMDAFKAEYDVWEAKCKDIKENAKKGTSVTSQDIETLINDIYEQRKQGLTEGEYSIGNLIFKELRNVGLLDELKELKNEVRGKELSLKESVRKRISFKK